MPRTIQTATIPTIHHIAGSVPHDCSHVGRKSCRGGRFTHEFIRPELFRQKLPVLSMVKMHTQTRREALSGLSKLRIAEKSTELRLRCVVPETWVERTSRRENRANTTRIATYRSIPVSASMSIVWRVGFRSSRRSWVRGGADAQGPGPKRVCAAEDMGLDPDVAGK